MLINQQTLAYTEVGTLALLFSLVLPRACAFAFASGRDGGNDLDWG
jgi:hypothetical protein